MTSRNWLITSFNPCETKQRAEELWLSHDLQRYVGQYEVCPETGRLHYQGYVVLNSSQRFTAVKKLFGDDTLHVEKRKGTEKQAYDYCTKEETRCDGPWENGNFELTQGRRTDLDEVKRMLDDGATDLEVAETHFQPWVRHHAAFSLYRTLRMGSPRDGSQSMVVKYLYGVPGSGKTRSVYEEFTASEVYPVSRPTNGSLYYDGYAGQRCILYDDFLGWAPLSHMLAVMDRYPCQLKVHGGMAPFSSRTTTIIITSNKPWEELYDWPNTNLKNAFRRRITKVTQFIDLMQQV